MLTEEQIYMEAATHEAVDRNPLLASEKPYTKGFSAGAFWANGQNAAEIAAKDAEIAELVDALRMVAPIMQSKNWKGGSIEKAVTAVLAKYPE